MVSILRSLWEALLVLLVVGALLMNFVGIGASAPQLTQLNTAAGLAAALLLASIGSRLLSEVKSARQELQSLRNTNRTDKVT